MKSERTGTRYMLYLHAIMQKKLLEVEEHISTCYKTGSWSKDVTII
jgi:hypothetical protein